MELIVNVPDCPPEVVGMKETLMVQLAPAASVVPQVFVCAKGTVGAMAVMLMAVGPLLVRVTFWAGLVVPTPWLPNDKL